MGKKRKIIKPPAEVIEQINKDIDGDKVRVYEVGRDEVPQSFIRPDLIHRDVISKSKSLAVGLSACPGDSRRYIYLAAERIDQEKGITVTDFDPIVMAYDLESGSAAPSGVTCFHAKYDGRTEVVRSDSLNVSINDLEKDVQGKGTEIPFAEAPQRLTQAMHYSAKVYRETFDGEKIDTDGETRGATK